MYPNVEVFTSKMYVGVYNLPVYKHTLFNLSTFIPNWLLNYVYPTTEYGTDLVKYNVDDTFEKKNEIFHYENS